VLGSRPWVRMIEFYGLIGSWTFTGSVYASNSTRRARKDDGARRRRRVARDRVFRPIGPSTPPRTTLRLIRPSLFTHHTPAAPASNVRLRRAEPSGEVPGRCDRGALTSAPALLRLSRRAGPAAPARVRAPPGRGDRARDRARVRPRLFAHPVRALPACLPCAR
jgi:hypothetical protein